VRANNQELRGELEDLRSEIKKQRKIENELKMQLLDA
jgi:cell division protein FtsL